MRRYIAASIIAAAALLLGATPALAETVNGPFDYSVGSADRVTGVLLSASSGATTTAGTVGIQRQLGAARYRIAVDFGNLQAGLSTAGTAQVVQVCARFVNVAERCSDVRGQVGMGTITLEANLPGGTQSIEVSAAAPTRSSATGAGASAIKVTALTLTAV